MEGSYVDEPLLLVNGTIKTYLHDNHLYSVAAATDSTGAVVERYRYDAYGRRTVLAANGTTVLTGSTIGNQRSFTGLYEDAETGLLYARARYMSPTLGRFVGRDPLDYVDGMSLYSSYFVPNALDPSGTDCISSAYAEFKKIKCCPSDLACWAKEMARITTFYNSCLHCCPTKECRKRLNTWYLPREMHV